MNRVEHCLVYQQAGRFAGWPANYGLWAWGSEIVLVFVTAEFQLRPGFHACNSRKTFQVLQARSFDGGVHWQVEDAFFPSPGGRAFSADEHVVHSLSISRAIELGKPPLPAVCPGQLSFISEGFGLLCARTGLGTGTQSWFYITHDRALTWQGPYCLPDFGLPGIEARTDYLVNGPQDLTLFLTVSRQDGEEGGGVICARTRDGGLNFALEAWVCRSETQHHIMPSSQRLPDGSILSAVRGWARGGFSQPGWIDLYRSEDDGHSFHYLARPVPDTGTGGNPPSLACLADGRLALIYGVRKPPFGIRARLSADQGKTWGDEIMLRADGGGTDLGYPRSVVMPDGMLVSAYYFHTRPEEERFIAATRWQV